MTDQVKKILETLQQAECLPETPRDMLDLLDWYFVTYRDTEAVVLWDVLSGLRGPDAGYHGKRQFTVPLRAWAFPQVAETRLREGDFYLHVSILAQFLTVHDTIDNVPKMPEDLDGKEVPLHFVEHWQRGVGAASAIDDMEAKRAEHNKMKGVDDAGTSTTAG